MTVFVGVMEIDLWMVANASLKDRRRHVRSIIDRTKARHNVAVAEISPGSDVRKATIAIACVGANHHLLRQTLELILKQIESDAMVEVAAAHIGIR